MTDEAIIKALAELDGWVFIPSHDKQIDDGLVAVPDKWSHEDGRECYEDSPENYLTDYNPILKLIQKQSLEIKRAIAQQLLMIQESFYMLDATPRQLCIVLLKSKSARMPNEKS